MVNGFAVIANKLGDGRLEKVFRELAFHINTDIRNAKSVPLRLEIRSDFRELKAEVKRFEVAISRAGKHLLELTSTEIEYLRAARQTVDRLNGMCDRVLSDISDKGGRNKEPGRVICAVIVIESYKFTKGRFPGANNKRLQQVCDDYWVASGQETLGDLGNWRRSLIAALALNNALRREVRDQVREWGTE
jgi:hypothetical protein